MIDLSLHWLNDNRKRKYCYLYSHIDHRFRTDWLSYISDMVLKMILISKNVVKQKKKHKKHASSIGLFAGNFLTGKWEFSFFGGGKLTILSWYSRCVKTCEWVSEVKVSGLIGTCKLLITSWASIIFFMQASWSSSDKCTWRRTCRSPCHLILNFPMVFEALRVSASFDFPFPQSCVAYFLEPGVFNPMHPMIKWKERRTGNSKCT